MEMMHPNMTAIIVMALVYMGLGWLWYSPNLFGSMMCCSSKDECKSCSWKCYLGEFLIACVMGYVMSHFVMEMHSDTVMSGAKLGFWTWLGFTAPAMLSKTLWKGKSLKHFFVCSGYYLVVLMVMGAAFSVWH